MDFKNVSVATIAGGVVMFGLGFIIFALLGAGEIMFNGSGAASGMRKEFSMGAIVLLEIATAFFVAIIYAHWAKIKTFNTGAINGLWIGFLLGLIFMLDLFSSTHITTISGILLYAASHAIRVGIAGGVIGWVLGKME